jgi:hypothetical protein
MSLLRVNPGIPPPGFFKSLVAVLGPALQVSQKVKMGFATSLSD